MRQEVRGRMAHLLPRAPSSACRPRRSRRRLRASRCRCIDPLRDRITCLCAQGGLAGHPQVNIPGATVDGLPVGLSIIGPRGSDASLVAVARALEARRAERRGRGGDVASEKQKMLAGELYMRRPARNSRPTRDASRNGWTATTPRSPARSSDYATLLRETARRGRRGRLHPPAVPLRLRLQHQPGPRACSSISTA